MTLTTHTQKMLDRFQELFPVSDDEIIQRGIAQTVVSRIAELRQRSTQLSNLYGSISALGTLVERDSVSVDDHTLYTDLLEWRAVQAELTQLTGFLEIA